MKKIMLAVSAAVLLSAGSAAAQVWERQWQGPYGGQGSFERHCDGGSCSTTRSYTGPGGNTWTQQGYAERDGQGGWNYGGTVHGPRGTTTYGGSGRCSGGECTYSGGGTGPRGGTWSRSGSFRR